MIKGAMIRLYAKPVYMYTKIKEEDLVGLGAVSVHAEVPGRTGGLQRDREVSHT